MADGWLVGPFPESSPSLWNPVLLDSASEIQWGLVAQHFSSIGTIVMLSAVSLMLTASGLAVVQRESIDINHELTVAGFANTVSGFSGGLIALPSMTLTELSMTVGAPKSRLVGLVVAAFCAFMLFYGMSLIAWFPKAVLAGLLMFLGGLLTLGSAVLVHILTLPTELDASFGRAMPMLEEHGVIYSADEKHARRLLKAAAMTYVSASLLSLLNIARWWAILRR